MIYYTKDGSRSFYPQTEHDRFMAWVQKVSNWKLVTPTKSVGTGIAEPTQDELVQACTRPCSYRRADDETRS